MRRALSIALLIIACALVAALVLVIGATNTDFGRERVRRFAQSALQGAARHGIVRIGKIEGNLLTGFTLTDISIRDSTGAPFLIADTASASYGLRELARQRLELRNVRLVRPLVVLAQNDQRRWNYQTIFASAAPTTPRDTTKVHFGDWLEFHDVAIVGGHLIVRAVWTPSDVYATQIARDSAVRRALSAQSRANVVEVGPGSYRKVSDFRDIDAAFPYLRLRRPDTKIGRLEIAALAMAAEPFRPPAAVVRDARGALEFTSDSAWWRDLRVRMPGSSATITGWYGINDNSLRLDARADHVSFADLRWVYPTLPAHGVATTDFSLRWLGRTSAYVARNSDVQVDSARIAGDLAITIADTIALHDTDLRFANLGTKLIEQLVPGFRAPRAGLLLGRVALDGGAHDMRVNADVTFDDQMTGRSRVLADGRVGIDGGLHAEGLRLTFDPVQVALARTYMPTLPIAGVVTGTATVSGATKRRIVARVDLVHTDRGLVSRVAGQGEVRPNGRATWVDVDAALAPLSLAEVGRFAPAAGLRGSAAGPVRLTGSLGDLRVRSDLRMPSGGALRVEGTLDLASAEKGYALDARMRVFDAHEVLTKAPRTALTAVAYARGRGFSPATMRAELGADLAASRIDTLALDTAHVRVAIADGIARIDSVQAGGATARARITGTFGLAEGRTGALVYDVVVDSLSGFRHLFPPADTGRVLPRPAILAQRLAEARADSALAAASTEVSRLATGAPPAPRLVVDTSLAIARDSLAGALHTAGTIRGSIARFDLRGRLAAENIVAHGNAVRRARAEYTWLDARAPDASLAIAADLDAVSAAGFALDSVRTRVAYRAPNGTLALAIHQSAGAEYTLGSQFVVHTGERELHIDTLVMRFDTTRWTAPHPALVRWGRGGLEVERLELRNNEAGEIPGRVFVDGRLPTEGAADLSVAIENFRVGDIVSLLQSAFDVHGLLTLEGRVEGTLTAPRISGAAGIARGAYKKAALPDTRATLAYADRMLVSHVEAVRASGAPATVADARVPIDLGTGVTGSRLLDRPLVVDVDADSLPLEVVAQFSDLVTDARGFAVGTIRVRGTPRHPTIAGALLLSNGALRIVPSGTTLTDIAASVRIAGDSVRIDSIAASSGGRMLLRGGLGIAQLTRPSVDLQFTASNARFLDNDRGLVRADVRLAAKGALDSIHVTGHVGVRSGVVYLPEPTGKSVIGSGDPALFAAVDTSLAVQTGLLPAQSVLLRNLRVDVTADVARDVWVRSKDANVEVFTPADEALAIHVNQRRQALTVDGAMSTERGEFQFMSKRFQIQRGTVTFTGTSQIDPLLQLSAQYAVRLATSAPLNIRVLIGGTARSPTLSLESDAQPPLSQSDLLSYLAFGRSTSSLLDFESSSLSSGGAGSLASTGATFVGQRLAGVALGVFVNEFEGQARRSLGVDVFNITPADVYTELLRTGAVSGFLLGTEIEAGKYTDPNTFIAIQARPSIFSSNSDTRAVPGLRLQRRFGQGLQFQTSFEPRFLLTAPSLDPNDRIAVPTGIFGAFLTKEWRW